MMKNLVVRQKKWALAEAVVLLMVICIDCGNSVAQEPLARHSATPQVDELLHRFAEGGKFKMLYDARQRPQGILVNDFVFIVYNGDAGHHRMAKGVPINVDLLRPREEKLILRFVWQMNPALIIMANHLGRP